MFRKIKADLYKIESIADKHKISNKQTLVFEKSLFGYLDKLSGGKRFDDDGFRNDSTHIFILINSTIELENDLNEYVLMYADEHFQLISFDRPVQARNIEIELKKINLDIAGEEQ